MSSIYKCPCCGEKSFNPLTKAMTGTMKSKVKCCPKCGKRCVNGKGAAAFAALYYTVSFLFLIFVFFHGQDNYCWDTHEVPLVPALMLNMYLVPKIVNGFCFRMMETVRTDVYR